MPALAKLGTGIYLAAAASLDATEAWRMARFLARDSDLQPQQGNDSNHSKCQNSAMSCTSVGQASNCPVGVS
jgi:hypothetical protein